jgi:hemoglobin/transferrin/lactoferrin receptor protein
MKNFYAIILLALLNIIHVNAQVIKIVNSNDGIGVHNPVIQFYTPIVINGNSLAEIEGNGSGEIDFTGIKVDSFVVMHPDYFTVTVISSELNTKGNKVILERKIINLNEYVMVVNKEKDPKEHSPFYTNVLTKQIIETSNSANTADLLQNVGSVLVQKSQLGGGSPIIRGFEASRVLIVVDGVRMNNAIFRAGHLQNLLRVDQNTLDRAEVMFGPGSVMYGSDAMGGTMYFKTKDPQLSSSKKIIFFGNAMARIGSADFEKTGHIDFNIAGKKFGSFTSVTFTDFDDRWQGANGGLDGDTLWNRNFYVERINGKDSVFNNSDKNRQVQSGYWQVNAMQKFLFVPNSKDKHILNVQFSTTSNIHRYDRLTELSGGTARFAEWYYGPETWIMGSYRFERTVNNWKIGAGLTYQYFNESRNSRRLNLINLRTQDEKLHAINANVDIFRYYKKHELKFGFEALYNTVISTAYLTNVNTDTLSGGSSTRYADGGNHYYSAALYVHDTWFVHPKVTLTGGIRLNYVGLNSQFVDSTYFPFPFTSANQNNVAVNGHLGVIYLPGKDWKLSLLASTGFRSPNTDDMTKVFDSSPGVLFVPNPSIQPEYSINGELNISKTFFKQVRVELVGFGSYLPSMIGALPFTLNGADSVLYDGTMSAIYASQNADQGYVVGFNANIQANITKYFGVSSSFNYTYGRLIVSGVAQPLDHIAPMYGRTAAFLNYKKWYAEASVVYSAPKLLNEYSPSGEDNLQYATEVGMPGWYTLNAKLGYSFNKYLRVQVALDNIMDIKYRTFGSGVSAAGRNIMVTLRSNF